MIFEWAYDRILNQMTLSRIVTTARTNEWNKADLADVHSCSRL